MLRSRDVELVCGDCGAVFARVHVRSLYRSMDITSIVNGATIMPRPGYSVNEESRQRRARPTADADGSAEVAAYLRRHAGEIMYDLTCRCGLRHIRSSPDLRRQIEHTGGRWVTLAPGVATWRPPTA